MCKSKDGNFSVFVFVTKSFKFRAKISNKQTKETSEITIGGKRWEGNDFSHLRNFIELKCSSMLALLLTNFLIPLCPADQKDFFVSNENSKYRIIKLGD